MTLLNSRLILGGLMLAVLLGGGRVQAAEPQVVRCAVIGGMHDTGLWQGLGERFEKATGHHLQLVARGPKHEIIQVFVSGEADIITMHSGDAIINLVADGYGLDPQPWAKNDFVIVGPASDPAKIRGLKDAGQALQKIIDAKGKFLLHGSQGASEVFHELVAAGEVELDPACIVSLPVDRHREMLKRASDLSAYTIVGRIPFLSAKIPNHEMQVMVQGDAKLRRPYLVVVANTDDPTDERHFAARQLARFLRAKETQAWLQEFGRGDLDDQPLFFPIATRRPNP
jgi:tungstate transport system substrate-binding protein